MATVTGSSNGILVYDPDGASNPLTIEFPESTLLVQGTMFSIFNQNKTSATTISLTSNSGSASDEIIDPTDRAAAPASSHSGLVMTRAYTRWMLIKDGHLVPTWYCLVHDS